MRAVLLRFIQYQMDREIKSAAFLNQFSALENPYSLRNLGSHRQPTRSLLHGRNEKIVSPTHLALVKLKAMRECARSLVVKAPASMK